VRNRKLRVVVSALPEAEKRIGGIELRLSCAAGDSFLGDLVASPFRRRCQGLDQDWLEEARPKLLLRGKTSSTAPQKHSQITITPPVGQSEVASHRVEFRATGFAELFQRIVAVQG
jgi:hypothetical protein